MYINEEIKASLDEAERNEELKKKTGVATSTEIVNKTQWEKYEEKYEEIKERLSALDFALNTAPSAWQIYLYSDQVKMNVEKIIILIKREPKLLIFSIDELATFTKEIELNTSLLIGLVASGKAVLQMEKAERIQLIALVLDEFRLLSNRSNNLYYSLLRKEMMLNNRKAVLKGFINKDKEHFKKFFKNFK